MGELCTRDAKQLATPWSFSLDSSVKMPRKQSKVDLKDIMRSCDVKKKLESKENSALFRRWVRGCFGDSASALKCQNPKAGK